VDSLHPTLRKSAKDGAPEPFWLFGSERVGHPPLLSSDLFEDGVERVFRVVSGEEGLTAVTTEGDEMEVFGLLETL
jgi:hypothetical protein